MAMSVNAGARLDRLPISSFHYRIFALVGAGMFFDGYDHHSDQLFNVAAEPAIPLAHLRRHDARLAHHWVRR